MVYNREHSAPKTQKPSSELSPEEAAWFKPDAARPVEPLGTSDEENLFFARSEDPEVRAAEIAALRKRQTERNAADAAEELKLRQAIGEIPDDEASDPDIRPIRTGKGGNENQLGA